MHPRAVPRLCLLTALCAAAVALVGCRSLTDPFMGVPEWRTVYYGDEDPQSPLKGVPKLTAVEERQYSHYLRAVGAGLIVAREFSDDWVYYAIATRRPVQQPGQTAAAGRSTAVIVERYKAKVPPEAPPPAPAVVKTGTRHAVTTVEMHKDRRKTAREIEKSLPEPPKVLPPEQEQKKSGWFDWLKGK
jgi:hypothetical protein